MEFYTLSQAAKRSRVGSLESVMLTEFRESVLLDALTIKQTTGAHESYKREVGLPTPQRRAVYGSYDSTTGVDTLGVEALRIYGSRMSYDRFLQRTGNADPVGELTRHTRAIRLMMEHELIYGDPTDESDPGQMIGLQWWSDHSHGYEADTSISAGSTAGGAALSIKLLRDAIDNCQPGATHLVCGKQMRNVLTGGAENVGVSGSINYVRDDFGRRVATFDDLPILTVNRDHEKQRLLTFNEAAASGSATAGSIYIISHQPGEGYYPFANGLPFTDLDLGTAQPQKYADVEYYFGVIRPDPLAVIRIKHIGNLPMVQ